MAMLVNVYFLPVGGMVLMVVMGVGVAMAVPVLAVVIVVMGVC